MKKTLLRLSCLFLSLLFSGKFYGQPVNTNMSNGVLFDGEPCIAINPANSQNLAVAWMGLVFSGGQFKITIKTRASQDGGNSWSNVNTLPHFGSTYGSADVSLAFNKSSMLFISYIDYRQSPDSGGIYVARSVDGGLTWDAPSKAFDIYDDPSKRPVDRPWLVVDRSNTINAGTLYITTKPAPWIAPPNRNYFKASSDNGFTWTPIANVDGGSHLVGNAIAAPMAIPATTANGIFCAVYPSYVPSQNTLPAWYFAYSSDKGQSFSYTTVLAAVPAPLDTNCKNVYCLAPNPADSNQMVFISPKADNGDADIMAQSSNDGGQTWSVPVRVNDDPIGNGKPQDMLWTAYNEKGDLVVTWRDRRNSAANGFWNAGYDFYYATSNDNGQTFSSNQLLTTQFVPFDSILTANGNDVMSCTYFGDTLYTAWGDTRTGKMNIFFAKTVASLNTGLEFKILEGEDQKWLMFPNPANNYLDIIFLTHDREKEFSIFDAAGKKVLSKAVEGREIKINTQALGVGIYYLKMGDEIRRFIKE